MLQELELYAPFVTEGMYLVVEDTFVEKLLPKAFPNGGPGEAIDKWLPAHPEFIVDKECEKLILTYNPGGWLLRKPLNDKVQ